MGRQIAHYFYHYTGQRLSEQLSTPGGARPSAIWFNLVLIQKCILLKIHISFDMVFNPGFYFWSFIQHYWGGGGVVSTDVEVPLISYDYNGIKISRELTITCLLSHGTAVLQNAVQCTQCRYISGSTLFMYWVCYLTAPSHYMNQCRIIISSC